MPLSQSENSEHRFHPPIAVPDRIVIAWKFAGEADVVAVARLDARDARDLVIAGAVMLRGVAVTVGAQGRRPGNDAAGVVAVDAVDAPDFRARGVLRSTGNRRKLRARIAPRPLFFNAGCRWRSVVHPTHSTIRSRLLPTSNIEDARWEWL